MQADSTRLQWLSNRRSLILTDENVYTLYRDFFTSLRDRFPGLHWVKIPAGERSKTRQTKEVVEDEMLRLKFGRDALLIAIGGGVILDLGGFIAATYCRGIDAVFIPTTLLAMVDACVGGKCGVNTPHGKNLIGAFYEPKEVLIDCSWLKTLNAVEMQCGLAEMVKHGLIGNREMFLQIRSHFSTLLADVENLESLVKQNIVFKQNIVENDYFDEGLRSMLNFGHTIGHALEVFYDFQLSHGTAVWIGMEVESLISRNLGVLEEFDYQQIQEFLGRHRPLLPKKSIVVDEIIALLTIDKKTRGKNPRFIFPEKIGKIYRKQDVACHEVDLERVRASLDEYLRSTLCQTLS